MKKKIGFLAIVVALCLVLPVALSIPAIIPYESRALQEFES